MPFVVLKGLKQIGLYNRIHNLLGMCQYICWYILGVLFQWHDGFKCRTRSVRARDSHHSVLSTPYRKVYCTNPSLPTKRMAILLEEFMVYQNMKISLIKMPQMIGFYDICLFHLSFFYPGKRNAGNLCKIAKSIVRHVALPSLRFACWMVGKK